MPVKLGPGPAGTDSLVFHMDLGDIPNGFPSMPLQNKLLTLEHSYPSGTSSAGFEVRVGETEEYIPGVGKRTVKYTDYYNDYPAVSTNCCPNLFRYHSNRITGLVGDTMYTYSIVYKHSSGYTHPNFMYRYEYDSSGTYLAQGGVHSTSSRNHLGNGWYHAWGTFITQPTTSEMTAYSFLYNYSTWQRFSVAAVSLVQGHHILDPRQMLAPQEEKTSTQSILDLTGNKSITVPIEAFNSDAEMEFDGTSFAQHPYLTDGDWQVVPDLQDWTMEHVVRYNVVPGGWNNETSPTNFFGSDSINENAWFWSALSSKLALWNISPGYWRYGDTILQPNTWYHVAIKCYDSGTRYQMYLNGEPEGGDHVSQIWSTDRSGLRVKTIGAGNSGNRRTLNGEQPITKIYTRSLTDDEIRHNYQQYKTRFNF